MSVKVKSQVVHCGGLEVLGIEYCGSVIYNPTRVFLRDALLQPFESESRVMH